jgi:hypothetical protein
VAKHQLRDWVESRLPVLKVRDDEGELARELNSKLFEAGLLCDEASATPCPGQDELGFLSKLNLHRSAGFLIVQTAVGILCGYDESAYIYSWSEEGWRRVWQNEQDNYEEKNYKPQILSEVLISPHNRGNSYLVLTLGFESWCSSNWHDAYYRVFRLGPDQEAGPLVEGAEWAFHPDSIAGSLSATTCWWNTRSPVSTVGLIAVKRSGTIPSMATRSSALTRWRLSLGISSRNGLPTSGMKQCFGQNQPIAAKCWTGIARMYPANSSTQPCTANKGQIYGKLASI